MAAMTKEEVAKANRERIDSANAEKAAEWTAEQAAAIQKAGIAFSRRHAPGTMAQNNGSYWPCAANDLMLGEWVLANAHGEITEQTLERAFQALRAEGKLATEPQPAAYKRHGDSQESRISPQIKPATAQPLLLPYTRLQILAWSTDRLRQEMKKGPAHVKAINSILNSK